MILSELLHVKNVICNSNEIVSKKQVLEHIARMACVHCPDCNYVEILQALIKRERIGSTTLNHGVAIPHARVDNLQQPMVCLITLQSAISFYENEPVAVDIIFGILAPTNANTEQLNILSILATYLQAKSYRNRLRQAKTNDALYQAAIQPPPTQGTDRAEKNPDDPQ